MAPALWLLMESVSQKDLCTEKATFLGFRGSVITTAYGLPVDFAIATANTDDREVLPLLCERGKILLFSETKGIFPRNLRLIY